MLAIVRVHTDPVHWTLYRHDVVGGMAGSEICRLKCLSPVWINSTLKKMCQLNRNQKYYE